MHRYSYFLLCTFPPTKMLKTASGFGRNYITYTPESTDRVLNCLGCYRTSTHCTVLRFARSWPWPVWRWGVSWRSWGWGQRSVSCPSSRSRGRRRRLGPGSPAPRWRPGGSSRTDGIGCRRWSSTCPMTLQINIEISIATSSALQSPVFLCVWI